MKRAWLVSVALLQACQCAQLPDALFQCEDDGSCAQPGFECRDDGLCHPPEENDAGVDAGVDAGEPDAGDDDAGVPDAGDDAGVDDAGTRDAGDDAGVDDAGTPDAGDDAGLPDAGDDAGVPDAGDVDAGVDAGCTPTGAIDEPDPLQLDVDCDGFDGDLSRAVFVDPVNGLDTNAGTRALPVLTLAEALARGREQVYVATGTLTPGALTVRDAVSVYGGYDAVNAWARTSMRTQLDGNLWLEPVDGGRMVLSQLEVVGGAAANGAASVAVTVVGAAATSFIERSRLVGGAGGDGDDGYDGGTTTNGGTGRGGLDTDGGLGASAVACGDAGLSFSGQRGGLGGGVDVSGNGTTGGGGPLAGEGAAAMVCATPPCIGFDGGIGLPGAVGTAATARPVDPPPTFLGGLDGGLWFGAALATWFPATAGRGGGGAGGGGALLLEDGGLASRGGGAGGGGSGGCGGRGGGPGQAGGASIGLVLWATSPTLRDVQLVGGLGGEGGRGGLAGVAGNGGNGGLGAAGQNDAGFGQGGGGGRGGRGGNGGPGRQGPGGWGGPVVGLFCGGGAAPVLDATTTWQTGTPGAGGVGDPNGSAGGQPTTGFSEGCP